MSKNLYQKICNVMQEVETVFKNVAVKTYNGPNYKGVSHDDVSKLLHMPLAKNGIVAISTMDSHELSDGVTSSGKKVYISNVWASVELVNADNPDERIKTQSFAMGFDSQDKGAGKAYSMAIKFCLLKLFMLESADNEEERVQEAVEYKPSNNTRPNSPSDKQKKMVADLLKNNNIPLTDTLKGKLSNMSGKQMSDLIGHLMKEKVLPDELC